MRELKYRQLYPVIFVNMQDTDGVLYKYSYLITDFSKQQYPLGFLTDTEPVSMLTNKNVEEYDWNLIRQRILANNSEYCSDCKDTTKMIVIVDVPYFSNGLQHLIKDNIQLVTVKEYVTDTQSENEINECTEKWYKKLYHKVFPEKQITKQGFFHKHGASVTSISLLLIFCIICYFLFVNNTNMPKVESSFMNKMKVTHQVIKHDTTEIKDTIVHIAEEIDTTAAINDTTEASIVVDTLTTNIPIVFNSKSPYQRMLDSLKGERLRGDSLAKYLRETRMIQIEFTAKISDGYTSRSVSSQIIVDSIRTKDMMNMSIALNDMANNMARERAKEMNTFAPIKHADNVTILADK